MADGVEKLDCMNEHAPIPLSSTSNIISYTIVLFVCVATITAYSKHEVGDETIPYHHGH